jgi:hypothetical protein
MSSRYFALASSTLGAVAILGAVIVAQVGRGTVRGQVVDGSDAVVPGVTVEATVANQVVAQTVTDAQGAFVLPGLPHGRITLRMTLDGFDTTTVEAVVQPDAETVVSGILRPASLSEQVTVTARAPRPIVYPPLPRPEPPYRPTPVPLGDLESVCGPAKPRPVNVTAGRLGADRNDSHRVLYRTGDELTIEPDAGAMLAVGQNYVARRYFRTFGLRGGDVRGEHTAGVVQVARVNDGAVTVVVLHACGELRAGDVLMPFTPEPYPLPEPAGRPIYREAARILFGEADQLMGAPGRMMVIDRGYQQGVRPGQRLTLFRRSFGGRALVGDAVVLAVREDSARIRVERASGVIWVGDSAAPHERAQRSASR